MPLRETILKNFWWKITALVLATAVWFTFSTHPKFEVQSPESLFTKTKIREFVGIPVQILKSPDDPRTFRVTPQKVDVAVSAPETAIKQLTGDDLSAFIAITANMSLTNGFGTNTVQINAPPGVVLEKAVPSRVQIEEIEPPARVEFRHTQGDTRVTKVVEFDKVPVHLLKNSDDTNAFRIRPDAVQVKVSGDLTVLEKLSRKDIVAFVEASGVEGAVTNKPVQVNTPTGVKLEKVTPPTIHVGRVTEQPTNE